MLPDRAGRGELEARIERLAKDAMKYAQTDKHEYERVCRQLRACRTQFHRLYEKKEQ